MSAHQNNVLITKFSLLWQIGLDVHFEILQKYAWISNAAKHNFYSD